MKDDIRLQDLLTGDVEACTAHTPLDLLERQLQQAIEGSLPVIADWSSRRLLGHIDRAVLESISGLDEDQAVGELVTKVHSCWLSDSPEAALATMRAHRVRVVHVADERGCLQGSLSWDQVFRYSDAIAQSAPDDLPRESTAAAATPRSQSR